jgi:hypothetical protein
MKTTNYNPLSVPIPPILEGRPRFHGIPIPFSSFIKRDGTPDFKVTDQDAWATCVNERRCGICGKIMDGDVFFIGGEKSIVNGFFFDPAMHEECARYSFAVCPFIAAKKEYSQIVPKCPHHVVQSLVSTERPKRMGILRCGGFQAVRIRESVLIQAIRMGVVEWEEEKFVTPPVAV